MNHNELFNGWNEIIAIRFQDGFIRFGEDAIKHLHIYKDYLQLLSRAEFKILCRLDFGKKWGDYAEHAPTIINLPEGFPLELRQPKMICHRAS